ncbi:MAG: hypothetical protein M9909_08875 [Thermomicrobiales bacterium]|nr:hypothetical protein [Thermomicrobiales bacterium]
MAEHLITYIENNLIPQPLRDIERTPIGKEAQDHGDHIGRTDGIDDLHAIARFHRINGSGEEPRQQ